jgi:hypothetical protein
VQPPDPDTAHITLTSHCLLRLMTALLLETQGAVPFPPSASAELNSRTGYSYTAAHWIDLLTPHFQRRFSPGERSAWPA